MSDECTIGTRNIRINNVMYNAPSPVCDEIERLTVDYAKLEMLARRMWTEINGDDEFFEDAVSGQTPATSTEDGT